MIGKPHTVPQKSTGKSGSVAIRLVPAPKVLPLPPLKQQTRFLHPNRHLSNSFLSGSWSRCRQDFQEGSRLRWHPGDRPRCRPTQPPTLHSQARTPSRAQPLQDVFTQSTGHTKTLGNFVKVSACHTAPRQPPPLLHSICFGCRLLVAFVTSTALAASDSSSHQTFVTLPPPGHLQRAQEHLLLPHP